LVLSYGAYTLDKGVLAIVADPIKAEFHLTDSDIGLLAGLAGTLPFLITCVPIGRLADRMNRKWLLFGLITLWSMFTGLAGLATSVALLYLSRIAVTAVEAGFTPVSMSLLTDSFPKRQQSTALGLFTVGAYIGIFLALGVGGLVASGHGWRMAFFLAGAPGLALGVTLALVVREPVRGRFDEWRPEVASPSMQAVLARVMRSSPLRLALGAVALSGVAPSALSIWAPSLLVRAYHVPLSRAGFLSALIVGAGGAAGAALGGLAASAVGTRHEWRKLLVPVIGGVLAVACGLSALLFVDSVPLSLALLALTAFFGQVFSGPGYAAVLGGAPPNMRGSVAALLLLIANVGSYGVGTVAVGFVSDAAAAIAGGRALAWGLASVLGFTFLSAPCFLAAALAMRAEAAKPLPAVESVPGAIG
jgi:MFS family permease